MFKWVRANWLILLVMVLAVVLRFAGLYPGYNQFHPDEPVLWGGAVTMIDNGNLRPSFYYYGTLSILINAIFYKIIFIPLGWAYYYLTHLGPLIDGLIKIPPSALEAERIQIIEVIGVRGINAIYWTRYVTAAFGSACVFVTYLLGKRLFSKKVGLIAAFFLVFNFKHVINSHLGLPDVYNAFFIVLSLLASVSLWQNPTRKNYLLAGIAAGLSFSVKFQIYAILPLLLAHFYASLEGMRINFRKLFDPGIFLAMAAIPLVFMAVSTFYFIDIESSIIQNYADVLRYALGRNTINLFLLSFMYHFDYGPPLLAAVLIGLIVSVVRFPKKALFLISSLILFIYIFFYYSIGGFFVRNIITITPVLLIFAAFAVSALWDLFQKKFGKAVSVLICLPVIAALVFVPAKNSLIADYYFTKPWNYIETGKWIERNIPKDTLVASEPFGVPTGPGYKKTEFEISGGSYSLAEHRENGAEYALANLDWAGGPFYFWMTFDFSEVRQYWNKPMDIMRNFYQGISMEELFRYQVFSATKPWQAPGGNYVIAKLPEWADVKMKTLTSFSFDGGTDGWATYGNHKGDASSYVFDGSAGNKKSGAIRFNAFGTKYPIFRAASPAIEVKEGHLYTVSGHMKTARILAPLERDGFLRMDFYKDDSDFNKIGENTSVSARIYGTEAWVKKEITERAPEGARFMTVSFQVNNTVISNIWIDDVAVYESSEPIEDITGKPPYIKKNIDLNILYPNSHGNL